MNQLITPEIDKLFSEQKYSLRRCLAIIVLLAIFAWYGVWGLALAALGGY